MGKKKTENELEPFGGKKTKNSKSIRERRRRRKTLILNGVVGGERVKSRGAPEAVCEVREKNDS
jgi:hypothetical protein